MLATALADISTKLAVLKYLDNPRDIIPGFFTLNRSFNYGAAFGIFDGKGWLIIFFFALLIIAVFSYRQKLARSRILSAAFGLVLGGATANIADRVILRPLGAVTDFLDFHIASGEEFLSYPTFNIADMCIVIGCIIILLFYRRVRTEK